MFTYSVFNFFQQGLSLLVSKSYISLNLFLFLAIGELGKQCANICPFVTLSTLSSSWLPHLMPLPYVSLKCSAELPLTFPHLPADRASKNELNCRESCLRNQITQKRRTAEAVAWTTSTQIVFHTPPLLIFLTATNASSNNLLPCCYILPHSPEWRGYVTSLSQRTLGKHLFLYMVPPAGN